MANVTPPGEPTEEQRQAAFRDELAASSRHGGRAMRWTVPPRAVLFVAATFLVLGVGGTVLEHFVGGASKAPGATPRSSATTTTAPDPTTRAALDAYIGLKEIASARAPAINLVD